MKVIGKAEVVDTVNTYTINTGEGASDEQKNITISGSGGDSDSIILAVSTGLSITESTGRITLENTVTDTNTQLSNEQVQDIVGGMVTGNTETGITVTYQDADGTLDFEVGTLNQNTTGNAATATALETARNIAGVSFDGTGDISLNNNAITNGAGYTTNTGDIDRVTISTSSGNAQVNSGNADFSLTGTSPISITNSGTDITVAAGDASESAKGFVELATTAEADTGTDTSRAVTPAGLKSHVDARYSYQYLTFSFKAQNYISETWQTPSQNGPEYYFWNNSHGTGGGEAASHAPSGTSVGSSTITVDYLDQPSAFVIPKACKLDGFYGNARTNSTDPNTARPCMGLFRAAEPSDSNNSDVVATCVAVDKYDTSTGNRKNRFMKLETSGLNTDLAQGDLLFPAIGLDEAMNNSAGIIWGSFTIVLKTLIP